MTITFDVDYLCSLARDEAKKLPSFKNKNLECNAHTDEDGYLEISVHVLEDEE